MNIARHLRLRATPHYDFRHAGEATDFSTKAANKFAPVAILRGRAMRLPLFSYQAAHSSLPGLRLAHYQLHLRRRVSLLCHVGFD